MEIKEIEKFFETNDISYEIKIMDDGKIVINADLDLRYVLDDEIPMIKNCKINGFIWLDYLKTLNSIDGKDFLLDCEIQGDLDLGSLTQISEGFLRNTKISDDLLLQSLIYLPKGFNVQVKGIIFLDNLKSKLLKELLLEPGAKRQLGFNLLR